MTSGKSLEIFYKCGLFSVVSCCFFIPLSTSVMGATAVLATVFWVISGNIKSFPATVKSNPTVVLALLLLMLLIGGVFYGVAEIKEAVSILKKYRELLYFIAVYSLVRCNPKIAKYSEHGFIGGCITLLAISYLMYFGVIPTEKFGYSTVYHITHSFFMALLAFWALQNCFVKGWKRYFWLLLLLLTAVNLFYIAPGRTGMIVFVFLVFLTLIQRLSYSYSLVAICSTIVLLSLTYLSSDNFSTRINQAVDEVVNYQPQESRTSMGMRFDWWYNSVTLIKQKPLLGHGTGSFETVQNDLVKGSKIKESDNPHNEYLLIAVQTGMVGLTLFVSLLGGLFLYSFKLRKQEKFLLQGVVVGMAAGCLINSFLLDSHQGHFFAILSAILCAQVNGEASPPDSD